jgi:hypothetical protein
MWTGAAHREDDPDRVEPVIECFPAMITDGRSAVSFTRGRARRDVSAAAVR